MFKNIFRPFVRFFYQLLKPTLRPLAFRTRRYLTADLQIHAADERQKIMELSAGQARSVVNLINASQDTFLSAISRTQSSLQLEINKAAAQTIMELQAAKAMHRMEILTLQKDVRNEMLSYRGALNDVFSSFQDDMAKKMLLMQETLIFDHRTSQSLINQSIHDLNNNFQSQIRANIDLHRAQFLETLDKAQQENENSTQASVMALQSTTAVIAGIAPRLDRIEQYSLATAKRVAVNCGDGAVLIRTEAGYILCSDIDHALISVLMETGDLEIGTRLLIQNFLKPGECFIDVGANIGMHTLAAAHVMKGQGKIVAFEPFAPTKKLLQRSIWMNGFASLVEVHEAAVSNESGSSVLYLGETSGHHSLFSLDGNEATHAKQVEVKLLRLDDVIPSNLKIDLLKIDAEGAELDVIQSALSTIKRNNDIAIIVEFGPSHLRRTGIQPIYWLSVFENLGMEYRVINSLTGKLEVWEIADLISCESANLLFSRIGSSAWARFK